MIYGLQDLKDYIGVIVFNIEGLYLYDVVMVLDMEGVVVRVGYYCV